MGNRKSSQSNPKKEYNASVGNPVAGGDLASNDIVQFLLTGNEVAVEGKKDAKGRRLFEVDLSVNMNSDAALNVLDPENIEGPLVSPPPSPPAVVLKSCHTKLDKKKNLEGWKTVHDGSNLGIMELPNGEFVFSMLMAKYGEDQKLLRQWLNRMDRTMRGLERQYDCSIIVHEKPLRHRGNKVHMIQIRGSSKDSVMGCKNAFPPYVQDRLITSRRHY